MRISINRIIFAAMVPGFLLMGCDSRGNPESLDDWGEDKVSTCRIDGYESSDGLVYRAGQGSPVLFIHGLNDSSASWNGIYKKLCTEDGGKWFDNHEFWTFQYDSSRQIRLNGAALLESVTGNPVSNTNFFKAIVAHSMGGLVARSFIAQGGEVDKLVTLGTPHNGSPLDQLRNTISSTTDAVLELAVTAIPALEPFKDLLKDEFDSMMAGTTIWLDDLLSRDGIKDLLTGSEFLNELNKNAVDLANRRKYVTFASAMQCYWSFDFEFPFYGCSKVADPNMAVTRFIMENMIAAGPNDGVVLVSSALLEGTLQKPVLNPWSHTQLQDPDKPAEIYEYIRTMIITEDRSDFAQAKTIPGPFGVWTREIFCPEGSYVAGFRQRVEPGQDDGDDTALNAVSFHCLDIHGESVKDLEPWEGLWGDWADSPLCSTGHFITGVDLRIEEPCGSCDDTAANDFRAWCDDNDETALTASNGMGWGDWLGEPVFCGKGEAVCGLAIQYERDQGGGDDTGMNGIEVFCCTLKDDVK